MDEQDIPRKKFLQGQRWTGLLLLIVGGALLLKQSGYPLPFWLFTWPMLLIVLGFFIGLRHGFRDYSWLIMMIVGGVFLTDSIYPSLDVKHYAIPGIIIFSGLIFLFAPKSRRFGARKWERREEMRKRFEERFENYRSSEAVYNPSAPVRTDPDPAADSFDSSVDIVSVFSGIKKKILSKSFKGGEVVCIFGGAELNLTNADFTSPITIEFVQIFGGTKLIVPANWEVKSEVAAIFGGIEDKRPQPPNTIAERTLILNGTVMFGGVEVNSF
jgi:predicted membrane protein